MREHDRGRSLKMQSDTGISDCENITSIDKNMKNYKRQYFFNKEKLLQINRIMRLMVLLVLCLNLTLSAKVYSQAERFSIQKENATVKEVFDEVMRLSNYHFFYNNEFDANRRISVRLKNARLDDIMKQVFEGQDYSYKLMDNYVIIKKEDKAVEPQSKYTRKITGLVKDHDGNPLPGVTVVIAGTTLGVATDIDGKFMLPVPGPGTILQISFVGKKTKEVVVQDQTHFNIVLEDDEKVLDEVVCTGMQTLSRERATGSFEILNAESLEKTLTSDVVSRLEGKVAGLQIGQNNKMTIRGRGSLYSSTDPLVVVDGFPIESGLSSVNPDDIASVTVLKDAAAASIWGVRAANGVIVITTKAGQEKEKPSLDISYFLTVESKADYRDLHLLSPADAVDLHLEQIQKGWWTPTYADKHQSVNKVQELYYNTMKRLNTNSFSTIAGNAEFKQGLDQLRKANLYEQFEKEMLRNALSNRLNISLRGGSERSNYYMSAVYNRQSGGNIGDQSNNLMMNLKHDYKLIPRLTLSTAVNVHYSNSENNGIGIERLVSEVPFHNMLDEEGNRIQYYMVDPWEGKNREEMGYLPYATNLLDEQEANDNTSDVFSARLQLALKLNIINGLDVETRFQYERSYSNSENLYSQSSPYMRGLINDNTIVTDGKLVRNLPMGARFDQSRSDLEAWTWRSQLTYNGDWNDSKHMLAVVLGHEMRMYRTTGRSSIQFGYDPNALTYIPIDETAWKQGTYKTWYNLKSDIPSLHSSSEQDNRDISVYLNGAYTFMNRYSLSASGRVDQSNLFGNDSDYKYNFIWSTGVSWRISEEQFAKTDWMDQLMLRFTYGIGGNVNKNFYPVLMGAKMVSASGVPYVELTNPANKNLTWEKSTTFNAGVDFAFLNHRIGGSLDYYHKKSTDLLGRVALDPTNGFESATMNFASILNQGIEVTLNTTPLKINDFTWNLGFNISYNKNEVIKVESDGTTDSDYLGTTPPFGGQGVAIIGKPLGRMYSYRYAGLNDQGEVMLWQGNEKIKYDQFERLPENLKYEGTMEAPWFGGINTSLEYKGITLSANATYKFGNKFRVPVGSSDLSNTYSNVADRWTVNNQNTNVPVLLDALQSNAQFEMENYHTLADLYVRDAAWLRLNEIALGYTFQRHLIRKTPFSMINVQFQVRNPALWTKNKENIDPEAVITTAASSTSYSLPEARSFILAIKLSF